MKNITKKLVFAGLMLGGIGSADMEAAYFRNLWSRAGAWSRVASAARTKLFGNYKKLGVSGIAGIGSVAYGLGPSHEPKQQNSEEHNWKEFNFETLDGERSYLTQITRTKDKDNKDEIAQVGWNIYYDFSSLNEHFGPTHPHMQIKENLKRNKDTGQEILPSVKINMEKCKIRRGIDTNSSKMVRVACKDQESDRLYDYFFRPIAKVYDDQHKEAILKTRKNINSVVPRDYPTWLKHLFREATRRALEDNTSLDQATEGILHPK